MLTNLLCCRMNRELSNRIHMKKISIAVLLMAFGFGWSTQAGDPEAGKGLTPEQQKQRTELIKKYDTNKDGVLDKTEAKNISKEDKKALARLGGVGTALKTQEKGKEGQKGTEPAKGDKGRK